MDDTNYSNRELDEKFNSLFDHMTHFEHDIRQSQTRIEIAMADGFRETHKRQDYTNGKVMWNTKMIWLAMGGLGVLAIIVFPLLFALIQSGKL